MRATRGSNPAHGSFPDPSQPPAPRAGAALGKELTARTRSTQPLVPPQPLCPLRSPCLQQHDVIFIGDGVVFRVLVVLEHPPDLLGFFWFQEVVSPQDDCDVPGHGRRRGKGEIRLGVTPSLIFYNSFYRQVQRAAQHRRDLLQNHSRKGAPRLGEEKRDKTPVPILTPGSVQLTSPSQGPPGSPHTTRALLSSGMPCRGASGAVPRDPPQSHPEKHLQKKTSPA